ncbi:MAG: murJ [Thermoleophilia bacterium]|nr:murJ [Thermoleophilia bacterium]
MSTLPSAPEGASAPLSSDASAAAAPITGARKSTVVVMLATLLTKVVGLVRETATAVLLGTGPLFSAFVVAFQIPNVIRTFVADQALVSSIVPVFTKLRVDDEEERAWRVASTVVTVLLLILVPLTALAMVFAEFFIDTVVYDNFNQFPLAIDLFRILIPVVLFMSIGGVVIGILNSYGRFGPGAFAQLAFNAFAVALLFAATPFFDEIVDRVYLYAVVITAATFVQAVMPMPWLRGRGHRLVLGFAFRDPMVKAVVIAMLPVMLSLAMMNLNNIVNTYWSSRIPVDELRGVVDAGPGVIYRAWSVFQLPQGIFSLAVATVFLPLFARHSATDDRDGFRDAVGAGIRQISVLLMPASVFLFVLAEPIVELLFEYNQTNHDQSLLIASALRGFAIGLVGNGAIQLLMRAYFSLKTPWTPAVIGFFFNFLGNIVLGGLLHTQFGVFGVTLAMGLANTISFLAMWYVLHRRLGGMPVLPIVGALVLSAAASAVSVGAGWLTWDAIRLASGDGLLGNAASMLAAIVVTWGIYAVLALKLRLVNVPQLRKALKRGR